MTIGTLIILRFPAPEVGRNDLKGEELGTELVDDLATFRFLFLEGAPYSSSPFVAIVAVAFPLLLVRAVEVEFEVDSRVE